MGAPVSNVDVCNMACDAIGVPPITSVDAPVTDTEKVIARHYDDSRRDILRESAWGFAKARKILARSGTPDFDYADMYTLPDDFIRLLTINEFDITNVETPFGFRNFEVSNNSMLINAAGATTLKIRYIKDVVDPHLWDSKFPRIVALKLAMAICITLTNDTKLLASIAAQLDDALTRALPIVGQENKIKRVQRSRSLEARRGGNAFGNTILGGTYVDFGGS